MWHKHYNNEAMDYFNQHGVAKNQAADYWATYDDQALPKPAITPVSGLSPGTEYIAAIGLFHLSGAENGGNHHLYIDLIDQAGFRIRDSVYFLSWGWEGMTQGEIETTAPVWVDKPDDEPGANIGMHWGQTVFGFETGRLPSDQISGIHIRYGNTSEAGNHQGHHSHYVVLQRRVYGGVVYPPDQVGPVGTMDMLLDKVYLDSLPVDEEGKVRVRTSLSKV